jgi:hypothetical protein
MWVEYLPLASNRSFRMRAWHNGGAAMQTREKGNLTEAKILAALVAAGYLVSVPFGEGHKYDFIIDDSISLRRVQCKTGRVKKGALLFNSYSQSGNGATKQGYHGLADLFAVLNPESGEVYLERLTKLLLDEVPADQSAAELQECQMDFG